MLKLIKTILLLIIDDIDSGNSNLSEDLQQEALDILCKFNRKELSKIESAEYVGVSRATFDNYIKRGFIPEGHKRQGFKEKCWNKKDLDKYLEYAKNL